ncbi:MAG TPA: MlaD family protein [Myxococcota bacterium]|nr:MlaD family protein [Myxococcota bacterium]
MNQTNYYKLGAFVLAGMALTMGLLIWLGAADWNRAARRLVTYFDESVQGLEAGSPIKFRGVTVGTVSEISVASDLRHVRVVSLVYEDVLRRLGLSESQGNGLQQSPSGDRVLRIQLVSPGLTGVKFLSIDFFDARRFPEEKLPFDPGPDYLPSTPSTLKSIEEAAVDVGTQLPMLTMRASETLQRLADSVEDVRNVLKPLLADDGAVVRLLAQYERTGAQLEKTAAAVETELKAAKLSTTTASVRDAAAAVTTFSNEVSATAEDTRESLTTLQETLDSVRALTDYLERDPAALVRGRAAPPPAKGPRP